MSFLKDMAFGNVMEADVFWIHCAALRLPGSWRIRSFGEGLKIGSSNRNQGLFRLQRFFLRECDPTGNIKRRI